MNKKEREEYKRLAKAREAFPRRARLAKASLHYYKLLPLFAPEQVDFTRPHRFAARSIVPPVKAEIYALSRNICLKHSLGGLSASQMP